MIDFRVERSWATDGYHGWIIDHRNGRGYIAKPVQLEFEEIPEGLLLPKPTFEIRSDFAKEFIPALRKGLAGLTWFQDKEDFEASKRIEKAMQAHIDSLKLVVDRVVK